RGARPGPRGADRNLQLVEVLLRQVEAGRRQPRVDLVGPAGTDDGAGDAWPRQRPGHGDRRLRHAVALGNRTERPGQRQVALEVDAGELVIPAPPVVLGEPGNSLGGEGTG